MLTICVLSDFKNIDVGLYKKHLSRAINPIFLHLITIFTERLRVAQRKNSYLPNPIFTTQDLNVQVQNISLIILNHLPYPNAKATNHIVQAKKHKLRLCQ